MLQVAHAWQWDGLDVLESCDAIVRERAGSFNGGEAAQALQLFAELRTPLEEAHVRLLWTIQKDSNRMSVEALAAAEVGMAWAQQQHVHDSTQHAADVEAAQAAVRATRARMEGA